MLSRTIVLTHFSGVLAFLGENADHLRELLVNDFLVKHPTDFQDVGMHFGMSSGAIIKSHLLIRNR
jgi:hypothetical protein